LPSPVCALIVLAQAEKPDEEADCPERDKYQEGRVHTAPPVRKGSRTIASTTPILVVVLVRAMRGVLLGVADAAGDMLGMVAPEKSASFFSGLGCLVPAAIEANSRHDIILPERGTAQEELFHKGGRAITEERAPH
jgi:hypothetical protein